MNTFEVIDAFVDRERVDVEALKAALASDEGRSYLVDVLAMRELVADQPDASVTPAARIANGGRGRRVVAFVLASAASAVLAVGSYQWGARQAEARSVAALETSRRTPAQAIPISEAPTPTSVIYLEPGVDWHQVVAN
jgi:hypothetical protein